MLENSNFFWSQSQLRCLIPCMSLPLLSKR